MSVTVTIPTQVNPETLKHVAMVGRVVTYSGIQYKVYAVEGYDYYAFQSAVDGVTVDFQMTPCPIKREPYVHLLPMGSKIEEGDGFEIKASWVVRGVCLTKG